MFRFCGIILPEVPPVNNRLLNGFCVPWTLLEFVSVVECLNVFFCS